MKFCERYHDCVFCKAIRYLLNPRKYELLVGSYCEGPLQPKCRRLKWRRERNEEPPDDLCPNGYRLGSHIKIMD